MADPVVDVAGQQVTVSNLVKVLFPASGITKGQLIDYYRQVADTALPHYRDRPLTMQRYADGIGAGGFSRKTCSTICRAGWTAYNSTRKAAGSAT